MGDTSKSRASELRSALHRLEDAVNIPVLPGEGDAWARGAKRELEQLQAPWSRVREEWRGLFRQIREIDPELVHRVEQFADRENEFDARLTRLREAVERHHSKESDRDPTDDSNEPVRALETLRTNLLDWIVRTRAFLKETETWYVEAHLRERGESG